MKSRARNAALRWCLALENGIIQWEFSVIPITPFCGA
jgi:hypothetical protein